MTRGVEHDRRQCVSGAGRGRRCPNPAAEGFDYCEGCGHFLGAYLIQVPPGHPDRERMDVERAADRQAAGLT